MKSSSAFASIFVLFVLAFASMASIPPVNAAIQNGPRMNRAYFKMYIDTTPEWEGLKANEFDVMDWTLSQPQYQEWLISPTLQATINVEEEKDLGFFAFDINTNETVGGLPGGIYRQPVNPKPNPTGDPKFRAAVAKLVDKAAIATEDFQGLLEILDVPAIPPVHNDFINPDVIGVNYAFQYNGAQAQSDFDNAGYTQVPGADNPYVGGPLGNLEYVYPWAVPYIRKNALTGNLIQNDFDWGGGVQGLTIYSRADKPDRAAAGRRLRDVLRASGIPINYQQVPHPICNRQVIGYLSYHFYTGSWSVSGDPDHLHDLYTSEFANPYDFNYMLFNGEGPGMPNGWRIKSTALETLFDSVKYAPSQAAMVTAAKAVQAALWGPTTGWDPFTGGMPSIILGHYAPIRTAYRKGWMNIVNQQGMGVRSWWSTFLGYNPTTVATTMRMGLASRLEGLHPVTAYWLWDFMVMDRIFDTLIGTDAYNLAFDLPNGLAQGWEVGTWNDAGTTKTTVKFKLREGLKWHPNVAITFPEEPEGDGETEPANSAGNALTVDDVAFSWLYHQAQWGWFYSSCYQIKEVQTKNGPPVWPMDALEYPGGLTATWTANPALGSNEVLAKMNITAYLSLRWIGGVYILPMFIWKHVWDAYAFDPVAYDAVIGSGPYKLAEDGYVPDVSVLLDANRNYFLKSGSNGLGDAEYHVREMFHRRGDAGKMGGSGPGYYDGKVEIWDFAYFLATYSTVPYKDWSTWPSLLRVASYVGGTWTTIGTAPYLNSKLDGSYIYANTNGLTSGEMALSNYATGQYIAGVDFYTSLYWTQPAADTDAAQPLIDFTTGTDIGSTVIGFVTGDTDIGSAVIAFRPFDDLNTGWSLFGFAISEKHRENVAANGVFDPGEFMYRDIDGSNTVTQGDTRLTAVPNPPNPGYPSGSTVAAGDTDIGSTLTSFASNEKYQENIDYNGIFDPGEWMYRDADNSNTITYGDVRLTAMLWYPVGSTVFAAEKHAENVAVNDAYDPGEFIYRDVDSSDDVTAGDVRLTAVGSYAAGSTVIAGDTDIGVELIVFDIDGDIGLVVIGFAISERHTENIAANGLFDFGEYIYRDVDSSNTVTAGDVRLTDVPNPPNPDYPLGSTVVAGDTDIGSGLIGFAVNEKHVDLDCDGLYSGGLHFIYRDIDDSDTVTEGDIRLSPALEYPAGSTVIAKETHTENVAANGLLDLGEFMYRDVDSSHTVTEGDIRLTAVDSYPAGSTVSPPGEKHRENIATNGVFDPGEFMYRDIDNSGTVTVGDIRLTSVGSYAAGSTVKVGDTDIGGALVAFATADTDIGPVVIGFATNEKHRENVAANNAFDPGEFIYRDIDGSNTVTVGDVRLTAVGSYVAGSTVAAEFIYKDVDNSGFVSIGDKRLTAVGSYVAGSTVASGDTDIDSALIGFASGEKHRENIVANNAFDPGEFMYRDIDNSGFVSVGDVRLTAVGSYVAGSTVASGDTDIAPFPWPPFQLIGFAANEKHRENIATNGVYDTDVDIGFALIGFAHAENHRENIASNGLFDSGEFMYRDADDSDTVTGGDVRLTAVGSYAASSTVIAAEKHRENVATNGVFDPGEFMYKDADSSGRVSGYDVRLTSVGSYPAGSIVVAGEKHRENVAANNAFDPGEFIYRDIDGSNTVTVGDVRLTAVGSYVAGSTVASGDTDIDSALIGFASGEKHRENIVANNAFDPGEFMYRDVDGSYTVTDGDVRLTAVPPYSAGSTVKATYDMIKVEIWNSNAAAWQEVTTATPPAGAYDWTHFKVGKTGAGPGEWTEAMINNAKLRLTYVQVGLLAYEIFVDMAALDTPYWRDNVYGDCTMPLIYAAPISPREVPPFDGDGLIWNGTNWVSAPYPYRVPNPGAGPPYLYTDFNYDLYVNVWDFQILGQHWGTDAGSGW